jgi:hypothetical protein
MNLDFNENPVSNLANYREEVFKMFPELLVRNLTIYLLCPILLKEL